MQMVGVPPLKYNQADVSVHILSATAEHGEVRPLLVIGYLPLTDPGSDQDYHFDAARGQYRKGHAPPS